MTTTVCIGAAALIALASSVSAQPTSSESNGPRAPHLEVAYASTLQGTEAMFAVRVCARGDEHGSAPVVRETLVDGQQDIVVRVVDSNGAEISRYAGSAAVCDYAKFAAALIERRVEASTKAQRQ